MRRPCIERIYELRSSLHYDAHCKSTMTIYEIEGVVSQRLALEQSKGTKFLTGHMASFGQAYPMPFVTTACPRSSWFDSMGICACCKWPSRVVREWRRNCAAQRTQRKGFQLIRSRLIGSWRHNSPQNARGYMAEQQTMWVPCETYASPAFPSHSGGSNLHIMASTTCASAL